MRCDDEGRRDSGVGEGGGGATVRERGCTQAPRACSIRSATCPLIPPRRRAFHVPCYVSTTDQLEIKQSRTIIPSDLFFSLCDDAIANPLVSPPSLLAHGSVCSLWKFLLLALCLYCCGNLTCIQQILNSKFSECDRSRGKLEKSFSWVVRGCVQVQTSLEVEEDGATWDRGHARNERLAVLVHQRKIGASFQVSLKYRSVITVMR